MPVNNNRCVITIRKYYDSLNQLMNKLTILLKDSTEIQKYLVINGSGKQSAETSWDFIAAWVYILHCPK